jgi:hypothetical protein
MDESRESTLKIESVRPAFDTNFRPIELQVWDPATPQPTDPEVLGRTVRKGDVGALVEIYSWYYFRLPFGPSLLAAALTLSLVILPIIVIASQEALRAVPVRCAKPPQAWAPRGGRQPSKSRSPRPCQVF